MSKLYNKLIRFINKSKTTIKTYVKTNIIFLSYVVLNLFNSTALRYFTTSKFVNIKPFLADLAIILLIGSLSYFLKPKKRINYYLTWTVLFTAICFINSVYYNNYVSFASFSLLASTTQAVGVANAVTKIFELKDVLFLIPLILFIIICHKMKRKNYLEFVSTIEASKLKAKNTLIVGLVTLGIFGCMLTGTDLSRLMKQWNREYVVMQFGIYTYQFNDLVASLKPQISPLFGLDQATKEFREYYTNNKIEHKNNKYTNIYKDKNVLVIHAESIQNWLIDYKINGVEVTPTLNKLSKEGMYFSNFYSEEAVGTSSDTEFTILNSLLPASSGTVFVSYWDRKYPFSTLNLLKEKGYYTFSMHGNHCTMWNRNNMYRSLGYDKFYCYTNDYDIDETIGLGLSDKSFFRQSADIIENINNTYDKYYGTLIMLTNHTPWSDITDHSTLDVTMPYVDPYTYEYKVAPYLEGTTMGDYIKSVNYADLALGEFINTLDSKGLLDDTILVIYGDHDSKLKKSEYVRLYNYDPVKDGIKDEDDESYIKVDYASYEVNRKVPFIIWTKEDQITLNTTRVMGMYDVQPTLGNMLGINNPYALGKDIFNVIDNVVVFPSGNWITDKMYYSSQKREAYLLTDDPISVEYIEKYNEVSEKIVSLSDKIIVYNLFDKLNEASLSLENK